MGSLSVRCTMSLEPDMEPGSLTLGERCQAPIPPLLLRRETERLGEEDGDALVANVQGPQPSLRACSLKVSDH